MTGTRPPKCGQRVQILTCHSNLAQHVGQVGTVVSVRFGQIRVFVNTGLCRATEVGPLSGEDAAGEDEETSGDPR